MQPPRVDTNLLPGGPSACPAPGGAQETGGPRRPRRLRWDVAAGCLLALVAVVVTVLAVAGLRGPAPSAPRAAAPSPGSRVVVARTPAGLHVTERLTLPRPLDTVDLTRPDLSSDRNLSLPQPVISGLTAAVGDGRAQARPTPTGWQVTARRPLREVTVDYDVAGAVVPEPQAPVRGRALLVVTPLTAATARLQGVPVDVTAPGVTVRQATCLTSPATQQLCGTPGPAGWTARLSTWQDVAVVVLQADLH